MVNDVRLPGMLHARMIRPTVAGAVPVKVDEGSIKHIPGAKVVWIKDLLAVVAEKEWNAVKAARALKVTWSESKPNFPGHDRLLEHIRKAPIVKREFQRRERQLRGRHQAGRPHHRGRIRIPDPVALPAWARPARSRTCATARRRSGPRPRSPTTRPIASPNCSVCRATRCARSGCSAPAPTVATTRATPPPTPRCCRSISVGRCACSTCGTKASPGTPRARPRSTAAAPASTPPAR